jgi:polyferredoxin
MHKLDLKKICKFLFWLLFFAAFLFDAYILIAKMAPDHQHSHQFMMNMLFRTVFLIIEIIIIGMAVYYIIKRPKRRPRLISLMSFNILSVVVLPMITRDFAWMGALLPWPITLMAFDPRTSTVLSFFSMIFGFVVVPLLTIKFGAKGFCGYICPLGGLYSETYGRLFHNPPGRLRRLGRIIPPIYFSLMTVSLFLIFYDSSLFPPIRRLQIISLFLTSHFFFFVIGIPFIGSRSFCTLICPLGYEIRKIVKIKNKLIKKRRFV